MFKLSKLSIALFGLLSAPSYGLESEEKPDDEAASTEVIVVRASGLNRDIVEMARPVSVLSGDELVRRAEASLGETLKFEPGVHGNYFGPVASSPVIRGLDGARVQVVRNGMSTADVSREGPDHAITAYAMTAQQIEILRGPASLLYGSGAMGGVVNVVDNRIPRAALGSPETRLQSTLNSSARERTLGFSHDSSSEAFAFHADGHFRKSNDYRVPSFSTEDGRSSSILDNSWAEQQTFNVGVSHVADWGFIGLGYGYIDSEYGLPEGPMDPEDDDDGEYIKLNQHRIGVAAEVILNHPIWKVMTADVAFTNYDHAEYDDGEPETEFVSRTLEFRLTGAYSLNNGNRGIVGYHGSVRDYEASGEEAFTPNTDTDSHAIFLLNERQLGSFNVEAGARFERLTHRASDVADAMGTRDIRDPFNLLSWSLGTVYQLNDSTQLTASYSQAERAPIANELYANGVHVGTRSYEVGTAYQVSQTDGVTNILSDPNLSSTERANNIDIGLRRALNEVRYQVNFFYNQIANFAYLRDLGFEIAGFDAYQYTQEDAILQGFEGDVSWQFHPAQRMTLMADSVRARLNDGGKLPRIPPYRVGTEYQYMTNQWVATIGLSYFGSQNRVAENEDTTSGYTLLEASINYDFRWHNIDMMWFARIQNATNQLAFVHSSFIKDDAPLPGRNLTLGVQARF